MHTERDSPRDQLVVTLFLLTVFGLLLAAGVKTRIAKAGLASELPWQNGRRWWEVRFLLGVTEEAYTEEYLNRRGLLGDRKDGLVWGKTLGVQTMTDFLVAIPMAHFIRDL